MGSGTGTGARARGGGSTPVLSPLETQMIADLQANVYLSGGGFSIAATLTVGESASTIYVVFDEAFEGISPAGGEVSVTSPNARCLSSDVTGVVCGYSTLQIGGTIYKIIDKQALDSLETVLILSKD